MELKGLTPILNVSDIKAAFAWFGKLGWNTGFEWGDPVGFGSICSGDFEIFLCQDAQGGRGRGSNTHTFDQAGGESADKGVWMSWWVDDVDAVHKLCIEQSIDITHEPEDMPWGVREMHIRHPDGHVFRVGQSTLSE